MAASLVDSCTPSWPSDLNPYCFRLNPPASFTSNSATLRLTAPKSMVKNDFEFNISIRRFCSTQPTNDTTGGPRVFRGMLVVVSQLRQHGQTEKCFKCSTDMQLTGLSHGL